MLSTLLGRPITVKVYEDNSATITAAEKGYSPSLRHLARHQRCALGTVHETFFFVDEDAPKEEIEAKEMIDSTLGKMLLEHKDTKMHKGDFFTKELSRQEFDNAKALMGMQTHPTTS